MKKTFSMLLILVTSILYAQNSIEGIINNYNTNKPIVFANIYLPQLEKGTTTNEHGKFSINNLPSGNYTLIVSYVGFETVSKTISIPINEILKITLKSSAIEIEEIIISTPFHKLQSENVMKVERKTISDLKSSGSMTLSEGITSIAGVASVSTGVSIGKPVIRGLSSNRVLVYTQGVRLENQQFGDEHGLGINDSGIESVEVIKGPASLLYGSDALGGVLYFNPEKFAKQNSKSGDVGANYFSNTQGYSTNAGFKASGEHFKFLFRGNLAEHSDYKTKDYRVTNTRFREQDFKAGVGYQTTHFKTEFRYNVNNSKLGIPEEIGEQSTNKKPLLPFQEITNHVFNSKTNLFFKQSKLELNFGFLYNDRKEFEEHHHHEDEDEEEHDDEIESLFEVAALQMKLKTFNYDVKYHLPELGKFETIFGVQGMNQTNTNYGEEQLIPDATTNDVGILVTTHIHFENLAIQLGARFDNRKLNINSDENKNFNSFNGAFGIKTKILKIITARLNLATGFRAPNLAELTSNGTHEGTNRYEIGNINLKNEQNFQTDLALEFKNEHIELFANGFYNQVNNYIFIAPNGETIEDNPVFTYNQENAKLYGGEFGLHFHPHPIHWLHFESSFETVTGKQSNNNYLPLIPANSLTNTIRAEFNYDNKTNYAIKNSYVFAKLKSTFKQNNVSAFETRNANYSLLSAGFGGKIKMLKHELTISISGNNIANKRYINHLSRLKTDGVFNIGRNINIGLSYKL